jgi:hypothetical protein
VYDFFFGDQLRKHMVLISAFLLGQLFMIPLLGWLEPSQYVTLAVTLSLVSIWPLRFLYDRFFPVQCTEEQRQLNSNNKMLMMEITRDLENRIYDMDSRKNNRPP